MAKLSTDQLIDGFKELSLIELSEFVKKFEEVFEVTAAAPVAVAAAAPAGGGGDAAAPGVLCAALPGAPPPPPPRRGAPGGVRCRSGALAAVHQRAYGINTMMKLDLFISTDPFTSWQCRTSSAGGRGGASRLATRTVAYLQRV